MIVSQGILMLLLTAAAGTAAGWWLAERRVEARQRRTQPGLQASGMDARQLAMNDPSADPLREPEVSHISTLLVLVLIALVALGLGFLTWSSLNGAGKLGMSSAALPLVGLAGASLIMALALGPILEAVFEPAGRPSPLAELQDPGADEGRDQGASKPPPATHPRPFSRAA